MTRWLLVLALALAAAPAAAQNGFSFLDAAQSAIDYRVASAGPRAGCRDLLSTRAIPTSRSSARAAARC